MYNYYIVGRCMDDEVVDDNDDVEVDFMGICILYC